MSITLPQTCHEFQLLEGAVTHHTCPRCILMSGRHFGSCWVGLQMNLKNNNNKKKKRRRSSELNALIYCWTSRCNELKSARVSYWQVLRSWQWLLVGSSLVATLHLCQHASFNQCGDAGKPWSSHETLPASVEDTYQWALSSWLSTPVPRTKKKKKEKPQRGDAWLLELCCVCVWGYGCYGAVGPK